MAGLIVALCGLIAAMTLAAPAHGEPRGLCQRWKTGEVYCINPRSSGGVVVDIHPHRPSVTFNVSTWYTLCGVGRIWADYDESLTVVQESKRVAWYRYNKGLASVWGPGRAANCIQVFIRDCKAEGSSTPEDCNTLLDVQGLPPPAARSRE